MIVLTNNDGSVVNSTWPDSGAQLFCAPPAKVDLSTDALRKLDQIRQKWIETEGSYRVLREYESISPSTMMAERNQFIGKAPNKRRDYVDCAINFAVMHDGRPWDLLKVRFIESELFIPVFSTRDEVEYMMGLQAWAIAYRMGQVPHTCFVRLAADGTSTILVPFAALRSFCPWRVMDWAEKVLADPEDDSLDWLDGRRPH